RILKGCKNRKAASSRNRRWRTHQQWAKLAAAAEKLVKLLEKFGDGSGMPDAGFGAVMGQGAPGSGTVTSKSGTPGPTDQFAGSQTGADIADGKGTPAQQAAW